MPVPGVSGGRRRVVLVGAGHAHVQVLHAWAEGRPGEMGLTVVVDREESIYSGMVPGFVAGRYRREELAIAVRPLVEAAGGEMLVRPLTSVDPHGRRLFLEGGGTVSYDLASLNLGSVVAGRDVPGVEEHAVATRPLASFLERVEALGRAGAPDADGPAGAVVVGGGAAGVELAAALRARLGAGPPVTLLEGTSGLLPGRTPAVGRRARAELEDRDVRVRTGVRVAAVEPGAVRLGDGSRVPSGLTVWAAGAAPPPPLAGAPLPTDDRGFVRVRPTLQVDGHPDVFAVGDCASVEGHRVPRAGVYAVRQGPVLRRNLEAWLAGRSLERYEPQGDFLALLNLGDGRAMAVRWGMSATGRWAMWLKDRIDRRFVARFRR